MFPMAEACQRKTTHETARINRVLLLVQAHQGFALSSRLLFVSDPRTSAPTQLSSMTKIKTGLHPVVTTLYTHLQGRLMEMCQT